MRKLIIAVALGAVLILGVAFVGYEGSGWTDDDRGDFHAACVNEIDPTGRFTLMGQGQYIDHLCTYYTQNMERCFTPGMFSRSCLIR